MIDLHSHLLPGIDDGSKSLQESLKMARIYEKAGYGQVVATPHWIPGTSWMPTPGEIRVQVAALNQRIKDQGINLSVLPGMEIALDPKIPPLLDEEKLQPLGQTSYVLIETPFQIFPLGWEQIFFAIESRGYTVLLAHPERCAQLADKPMLFDGFIEKGIYLQINWDSFLGYHGREAARLARYLAAKGYIHCLATDSHDADNRHAGNVQRAAREVKNLVGPKNLQLLARENPARVLGGEPLVPMSRQNPQDTPKSKRRLFFGYR